MIRKYILLLLLSLLVGCNSDVAESYSVSVTGIALNKKGSTEVLAVDGLPAEGATLEQK